MSTLPANTKYDKIPYEDVKRMYHEQGLLFKEIAKIYNCSTGVIRKIAKRHNMTIIRGPSKFRKIIVQKSKIPLSLEDTDFYEHSPEPKHRCMEVILGTLLGDSNCRRHDRKKTQYSYNVCFGHSETQLEYLKYCYSLFPEELVNPIRRDSESHITMIHGNPYLKKDFYCFATKPLNLEYLYSLMYKDGRKSVTRKYLSYLTPLSLAIWHMDDGNYSPNRTLRFSTMGFTKEENYIMRDYFYEDLKMPNFFDETDDGCGLMLVLTQNSAKKFIELTKPYMAPGMEYKFNATPQRL